MKRGRDEAARGSIPGSSSRPDREHRKPQPTTCYTMVCVKTAVEISEESPIYLEPSRSSSLARDGPCGCGGSDAGEPPTRSRPASVGHSAAATLLSIRMGLESFSAKVSPPWQEQRHPDSRRIVRGHEIFPRAASGTTSSKPGSPLRAVYVRIAHNRGFTYCRSSVFSPAA